MVALRLTLIALVAALLVAGCGGAPEAVTPTAMPTDAPQPTAAPTTEPATPAETAASATRPSGGLGLPRDFIQAHFETAPYSATFKDAPASDGEPAAEGISGVKGIRIVLMGSPENVREAQVQATVGSQGASSEDALRYMIALLEVTAPKISNPTVWLQPHLEKAIKDKVDTAIEGNRLITIIAAPETGLLILSVQQAP